MSDKTEIEIEGPPISPDLAEAVRMNLVVAGALTVRGATDLELTGLTCFDEEWSVSGRLYDEPFFWHQLQPLMSIEVDGETGRVAFGIADVEKLSIWPVGGTDELATRVDNPDGSVTFVAELGQAIEFGPYDQATGRWCADGYRMVPLPADVDQVALAAQLREMAGHHGAMVDADSTSAAPWREPICIASSFIENGDGTVTVEVASAPQSSTAEEFAADIERRHEAQQAAAMLKRNEKLEAFSAGVDVLTPTQERLIDQLAKQVVRNSPVGVCLGVVAGVERCITALTSIAGPDPQHGETREILSALRVLLARAEAERDALLAAAKGES